MIVMAQVIPPTSTGNIGLEPLARKAANCTACGLATNRTNVVFGIGDPRADLMFVGEGPGREEDIAGEPFVGKSGKLLDRLMQQELGIVRSQCYIANVVKCRPPNNRNPFEEEISACRPFLEAQIREIDPAVIVTLGNFATRLLLDTTEGIKKVRGRSYRYAIQAGTATARIAAGRMPEKITHLVPTFHPAAALRGGPSVVTEMRADFARAKLLLAQPILQGSDTHPGQRPATPG
ncbi:MAG: uracil-DNA glycosylase [Actinobacteria bacterium]|nr:uracil-DNA glycosylase [Actinomycetota bacterium]MCL5446565.1 uracil-DNA glycosylase [Actinomycetota bacterium]